MTGSSGSFQSSSVSIYLAYISSFCLWGCFGDNVKNLAEVEISNLSLFSSPSEPVISSQKSIRFMRKDSAFIYLCWWLPVTFFLMYVEIASSKICSTAFPSWPEHSYPSCHHLQLRCLFKRLNLLQEILQVWGKVVSLRNCGVWGSTIWMNGAVGKMKYKKGF